MSDKIEIRLSTHGLSNIFTHSCAHDFTFVVGPRKFSVPRPLADFISPFVASLHKIDESVDSYQVESTLTDKDFELLVEVLQGKDIAINKNQAYSLLIYAKSLGNAEMMNIINQQLNQELTVKTVISELFYKIKYNLEQQDELDFIAAHFQELKKEDLWKLEPETLELIISNPNFKVETEDDLYEFISSLVKERGDDYRVLFEHVWFEFLDQDTVDDFINDLELDDLTGELWGAICRRLRMKIPSTNVDNDRFSKGTIAFQEDPMNGIIRYMKELEGKNPKESGLIDISYSSGNPYCDKLFEDDWKCYWSSSNSPDQWINFEFKKQHIILTNYTLKTANSKPGWNHLKSWVIEGSTDGINWIELDRRENTEELNGNSKVFTWSCANPQKCNNIRLRQTGKNHHNTDDIQLAGIEFFGRLLE